MRTRKEMEAIIRSGRSVFGRDGKLYSEISGLPSEAEIAKGDKEAEETARKNIKAELNRLASELAMLEEEESSAKAAEKEAKVASSKVASETAKESASAKPAPKAENKEEAK